MHDFPSPEIWLPHRVSYGETDSMGVMYYAVYFHLFERSRNEFIRSLGMSYADVEKRGIMLPVRDAECRYRHPARFDELVLVRAAISEWGRASIKFVYQLWNADKTTKLADASTRHAVVNLEGKPVPMPDWFRALDGARFPAGR